MTSYVLRRYEYTTKEDNGELTIHSYTIKKGANKVSNKDKLVEEFEFTYLDKSERANG